MQEVILANFAMNLNAIYLGLFSSPRFFLKSFKESLELGGRKKLLERYAQTPPPPDYFHEAS